MAPVRASHAPLALARTTLAGLELPGQVLRRTAAPLDFAVVDQAQRRAIVRGLLGAMHAPPGGVGLAAPMAGLDLRLVIAADGGRVLAMANPELLATGGGDVAYAEGNLCLPGVHAEVVRPATLTVRWQDMQARSHEETFGGWLGRILFHELELLDGSFFTDHVDPAALQVASAAQRAAAALAAIAGEDPPGAPGADAAGAGRSARDAVAVPLRVLTLPPDLLALRCSVLRRPADAVAASGIARDALRDLVAALLLTLHEHGVAGLSAPQVGVGLRAAVVDDQRDPPLALIDATVLERSEATETGPESCLSVPGCHGLVARPARIRVRNHTLAGEPYELDAEGPLARLIEHELDHLDGVLYPDRTRRPLERSDAQSRAQADFRVAYS